MFSAFHFIATLDAVSVCFFFWFFVRRSPIFLQINCFSAYSGLFLHFVINSSNFSPLWRISVNVTTVLTERTFYIVSHGNATTVWAVFMMLFSTGTIEATKKPNKIRVRKISERMHIVHAHHNIHWEIFQALHMKSDQRYQT